jgi:hypothetical protein
MEKMTQDNQERFRPFGDLFTDEQIATMPLMDGPGMKLGGLEETRAWSEADGIFVSIFNTGGDTFVKCPFDEEGYQEALRTGKIVFGREE